MRQSAFLELWSPFGLIARNLIINPFDLLVTNHDWNVRTYVRTYVGRPLSIRLFVVGTRLEIRNLADLDGA